MLYRSLCTLQLSCSFSCCIITCNKRCDVLWHVKVGFFPSITIGAIFSSVGTYSQHCATECVHIMHVLRLPIHWGNYIYWGVTLCGSLLVGMINVWAKINVEVCLVVFLVRLVAQCAVRSTANVGVKEGNFPVL
jgi:hypothetical protein